MKDKKDINNFFKDGLDDFRMEPPKKVRRKLLIVLLLGKLFSGYRKYIAAFALIAVGGFALFLGEDNKLEGSQVEDVSINYEAPVENNNSSELNQLAGEQKESVVESSLSINTITTNDAREMESGLSSGDVNDNLVDGEKVTDEKKGIKGNVIVAANGTTLSVTNNEGSKLEDKVINNPYINANDEGSSVKDYEKGPSGSGLPTSSAVVNESPEADAESDVTSNSSSKSPALEDESKEVNDDQNDIESVTAVDDGNLKSDSPEDVNENDSREIDSNELNKQGEVNDGVASSSELVKNINEHVNSGLDSSVSDQKDSVHNEVDDALAITKLDATDKQKKGNEDSELSTPGSKTKLKLSYVFAPYLAMDGALNNNDSMKYNPSYSVGVLGGVSFKNNLIYMGLAYETQVFEKTSTFISDSSVANYRTYYNIVEKQVLTVDTVNSTDSSGISVWYDSTYVIVPDSTLIQDTIYTEESFSKDGVQKLKLNYLSMPFYFAHAFKFGKHGVELSAGVTAHFLMNSKEFALTVPGGYKLAPEKFYLDYRFAVGYSYQVQSQLELFGEIRYKQVNNNLVPTSSSKAQYLGGSLGFRWVFD